MWLLLAVVSALTLGVYEVTKKLALTENAVIPVLFLNIVISAAIFAPFLVLSRATNVLDNSFFYIPPITALAHGAIFIKAIIVLGSWLFAYFAMKHLAIIVTTAVKSTQPVFILAGAVLIFGERLNAYQWAGIIVSVVALMLFSLVGKRDAALPGSNKWLYFIFLATLLGAISSLWDKHLVMRFDKFAVQVYTAYYQILLMIPIVWFLWYPSRKNSTPFVWRPSIVFISVFLCVSDFFYFYSLSVEGSMISVVSTLRKGGVVVPFIAGAFLFKEKNILVKAMLLGVVLLGMYLLFLGSK